MSFFGRAAKSIAHPTIEARLRAGQFAGLDPAKVEEFLGPRPVHFYDICDQPRWVKRARQWVYDAKRPEGVYPIHCWSAGLGGDVRSPLTWFACKRCGHTTLGSPHELPDQRCFSPECFFANGSEGVTDWVPMDSLGAGRALREIESEDFARRVEMGP